MQSIHKKIGETPLEALERYRIEAGISAEAPMTYAGRLDPLAEGVLLILVGDECKDKERYLGLNKEYEVEIVFGISTDTHDALGLVTEVSLAQVTPPQINLPDYVGIFTQLYPAYSSKTVRGVQLHELARRNELPEEMPTKEVEIYGIEEVKSGGDTCAGVTSAITELELKSRILANIALVKGDFRQEEIVKRWEEVLQRRGLGERSYPRLILRIKCSSGTYMRSLADRMGKDSGLGAFALGIKRTMIFLG